MSSKISQIVPNEERTCVLVDNCSLYAALQRDGIKLDMEKLKDWIGFDREITCRFYSGEKPNEKGFFSDFYRRLNRMGYETIVAVHAGMSSSPSLLDPSIVGVCHSKMICDLLQSSFEDEFETYVLVTGDAAFLEPVRRCKQRGQLVEIAFVEEYCDEQLRDVASRFRPLNPLDFRLLKRRQTQVISC
jgi:hypothetical protein